MYEQTESGMLDVPGEGMAKQEVEMHEHRHDQAIQRLKKIAGHVQAVVRMIEEGRDCPEACLTGGVDSGAVNG